MSKKSRSVPKKLNKKEKLLKEVWHELHSDLNYLQYIITTNEPEDIKQDMLFALFNCLSNRTQKLANSIWD